MDDASVFEFNRHSLIVEFHQKSVQNAAISAYPGVPTQGENEECAQVE